MCISYTIILHVQTVNTNWKVLKHFPTVSQLVFLWFYFVSHVFPSMHLGSLIPFLEIFCGLITTFPLLWGIFLCAWILFTVLRFHRLALTELFNKGEFKPGLSCKSSYISDSWRNGFIFLFHVFFFSAI